MMTTTPLRQASVGRHSLKISSYGRKSPILTTNASERIVHARGSGAHGYFEVTNPIPQFTKAEFPEEKEADKVLSDTACGSINSIAADNEADMPSIKSNHAPDKGANKN